MTILATHYFAGIALAILADAGVGAGDNSAIMSGDLLARVGTVS